jgi:hypothetical protein
MYVGPEIDDAEILGRLPGEYRRLLEEANGYIAYHGGLHVRGACLRPEWHSLRFAWYGDAAIHRLFPQVLPEDVPFAEDALGDQFVVRGSVVWKLNAESGDIVSLDLTLAEFDSAARANPDEFLALAPLHEFRAAGGELDPGQLLGAYPPFVFKESAQGVRLQAVPNQERRRFLAELAHQVGGVPDGAVVQLVAKPPESC